MTDSVTEDIVTEDTVTEDTVPGGDGLLSVPEQVARTAEEFGDLLDPESLSLTLMLYRTMAAFDRAHAEELSPVGLSVSQFNVLTVLHRSRRPLSMGEISETVSVRPANLTGVVDGLTDKSVVTRSINPNDRRSFLVAITEEGERFLAEFLPRHWPFLRQLFDGLSTPERLQLLGLLEALLKSIEGRARASGATTAGPTAL